MGWVRGESSRTDGLTCKAVSDFFSQLLPDGISIISPQKQYSLPPARPGMDMASVHHREKADLELPPSLKPAQVGRLHHRKLFEFMRSSPTSKQ